jgi:hypothetical protein
MCQSNVLRAADCSLGSNGCCCILNLSLDSFSSLCRHVSQMNLDMKSVKVSKTSSCHLLQITNYTKSPPLKHPSIRVDARPWRVAPHLPDLRRHCECEWPRRFSVKADLSLGTVRIGYTVPKHLLDHCIKFLFLRRLRCPRRVRRVPMSKSVLRLS